MRTIEADNALHYLRDVGLVPSDRPCAVRELAGGVSNLVLRVSFPTGQGSDFVVKQARAQLRTPARWLCTVERIWREVDVLRACGMLLDAANVADESPANGEGFTSRVPEVLFEDRESYLYAMTAAPDEHVVWKHELLAGRADARIARQCGRMLATLHAGSWSCDVTTGHFDARVTPPAELADLLSRMSDREIFDELRLEPYYRATAREHPADAPYFQRLIASVLDHPRSLVHADFSPKNLLVYRGGLMLVDFETGHFGDPAFDLGFFLSHLTLKSFFHAPRHEPFLDLIDAFVAEYENEVRSAIGDGEYQSLVIRGIQNLAGCAWARLDGTSRVDYLTEPARRDAVRSFCRELFSTPPVAWPELIARCRGALEFTARQE